MAYDCDQRRSPKLALPLSRRRSIEALSVTAGEFEVEVSNIVQRAKVGETLRPPPRRPLRRQRTRPRLDGLHLKAAVME